MKRSDELTGEISKNSPLGCIQIRQGVPESKFDTQGLREGFREVRGAILLGARESRVHGEGLQ